MGEFADAGRRLIDGAAAGLYQAAVDIMYVSQDQVPVETATLKSSARINEPVLVANALTLSLGYGYGEEVNPDTGQRAAQYAIPVHERTELKHEPPTKAKFLEDPALAYESAFGGTIAMWMQRATRGPHGLNLSLERITPSERVQGLGGNMTPDERRGLLGKLAAGIGAARAVGSLLQGGE